MRTLNISLDADLARTLKTLHPNMTPARAAKHVLTDWANDPTEVQYTRCQDQTCCPPLNVSPDTHALVRRIAAGGYTSHAAYSVVKHHAATYLVNQIA